MLNSRLKVFLTLVGGYVLLELLSWIGYNTPVFSGALFSAVVLAVAVLSWYRPGYGVVAVLGELFVGSQGGYMLALGPANIDGAILSLRMGLFLAVFGAWLARSFVSLVRGQKPRWYLEMKASRLWLPYLVLLAVFAFGAVRGWLMGHGFGNVFFDANGYAFFALFPAFIEGLSDLRARRLLWYVLAAAVTVSVAKALFVLYFFSHRIFEVAANMYVWIRDTRVGEVTIMQADFHRVFFQSHLFVLAGLFAAFMLAARQRLFRGAAFWAPFGLFVWGVVAMLLGLSRSYWFGGFVGCLAMVGLLLWTRYGHGLWKRMIVLAPLGLVFAVAIIAAVYAFPYPAKTGDVSFASLMGGRALSVAGEAAANSRWVLLDALWPVGFEHPFFGSGLGKTVTYTTSDPRLLADIPDAQYTTFAFEWGYHDLWIKFGLLGLAIYAWLIAAILRPYALAVSEHRKLKTAGITPADDQTNAYIVIGILAGVIAMLATNIFSPYLNHPLGIGLLMAVAGLALPAEK
jgi:hypothetical protein